jgi:hypothetical protein
MIRKEKTGQAEGGCMLSKVIASVKGSFATHKNAQG